MAFFKKNRQYVSEITHLIQDLKKENPQLEEEQRLGRALLWDKPEIDLDTMERNQKSRVPQRGYVYQDKL